MKEQIEELWNIITTDCDGSCVGCEFENDDWCFTHHAARAIYNAGYRKHKEGEWEEKSEDQDEFYEYCYKCSVCGHWAIIADEGDSHYCPNCGAHMRGGKNEN